MCSRSQLETKKGMYFNYYMRFTGMAMYRAMFKGYD